MTSHFKSGVLLVLTMCFHPFSSGLVNAASPGPEVLLEQLDEYPHSKQIAFSQQEVIDHEIGLGAIQKVGGKWQFKRSERLSGNLLSYTWQIVDGFTSAEVMAGLLDSMAKDESASELFTCKRRACGQGAQWANRVFHERVLYGRQDFQSYWVYAIQGENTYRLLAYSAARSADRQYLHVELLRIGLVSQP